MAYILVENRQIVHLGPFEWNKHRMLQSELNDLEVTYTVSPTESGYIKINNNFEIFPITGISYPEDYDSLYHDLAGPYWTYADKSASGAYTHIDKPLSDIRSMITQTAARLRYDKESLGTQVEIRPGVMVTADTSREGRQIFTQVYGIMQDGATVDWKFPEGWMTITKDELGTVIMGGAAYIQTQFDWEKGYADRAEAATTVVELKAIYDELVPPPSSNNRPGVI